MNVATRESVDFLTPGRDPLTSHAGDERTPWLLSAYCLLITLLPNDIITTTFPANLATPARLCAAFLLFLAGVGFLASKKRYPDGIRLNPGALFIGVFVSLTLIYWGVGLLTRGSFTQELSKATAFSGSLIAAGIALYTMVRIDTDRKRSIVLACLLFGVCYSAFFGILQHTVKLNLQYWWIPPGFEQTGNNFLATNTAIRRGAIRAIGTFMNPLPFGTTVAMCVPLAIHFARFSNTRLRRVLGFIAALILLLAVPTSIARSSLIVLAVSLLFYALAMPLRRIVSIVVGILGVVLVISFASSNTLQALSDTIADSSDDPSVLVRFTQGELMLSIFERHPLFGLGLGSVTIADFGVVDNSTSFFLAEGGIVAAAAFGAVAVGGIFGINGSLRRAVTKKQRDLTYALGAMFLGLISAAPTFAVFGGDPTYSLLFLLFGFLWAGCTYPIKPGQPQFLSG